MDWRPEGDGPRITAIRNRYPIKPRPSYVLIAGGIGVTPLLPMMRELTRRGAEVTTLYLGRIRSTMAFAGEVALMPEARIVESALTGRIDLTNVVAEAPDGSAAYAYGPQSLIDEITEAARSRAGTIDLVTESFGAPRAGPPNESVPETNEPFSVVLSRQGEEVESPQTAPFLRPSVPQALQEGVHTNWVDAAVARLGS